ncbi:Rpn family recombination-promoting nuclease/putative transposase [Butyrivibrio sp. FCS014]|uniref:Rpn family recombination-promoting nuclease/putative transposase n=1 Tax=Butyrivibrio sp. FCS014 TaxID=1408304 RepID=UPI0004639B15|nr:Rpn family recombination-promoting nuclease/putative transposase [Butyrivibrio sp. FCS014]
MKELQVISASREHKDRLFNFVFGRPENKKWTLSLYNAVNGSSYEDETEIEFNTLEEYLYVHMKNDTSFLFAGYISLYEHQSTYNPNMPLRMMQYISAVYDGYISSNDLDKYGEELLRIPTPKLVVFYNGTKDEPDEKILRLSDSFSKSTRKNADIEVKVRMININYGRNKELMEACRPLYEYSWFIQTIREFRKELKDIGEAVGRALGVMPEDFILKPFLREHMAEVANMLSEELQELNAKQLIARANYKKGQINGEKKGINSMSNLISWLFSQNRDEDVKKASNDPEYLEKLFAEYKEANKKK